MGKKKKKRRDVQEEFMKCGHETGMVSSEGMLWWVSHYWKTKKIVHKHCLKTGVVSSEGVLWWEVCLFRNTRRLIYKVLSWNGVGVFFSFFYVSKHFIGSFSLHFWPFQPLGLVSSKSILLVRVCLSPWKYKETCLQRVILK